MFLCNISYYVILCIVQNLAIRMFLAILLQQVIQSYFKINIGVLGFSIYVIVYTYVLTILAIERERLPAKSPKYLGVKLETAC